MIILDALAVVAAVDDVPGLDQGGVAACPCQREHIVVELGGIN